MKTEDYFKVNIVEEFNCWGNEVINVYGPGIKLFGGEVVVGKLGRIKYFPETDSYGFVMKRKLLSVSYSTMKQIVAYIEKELND